jgi:glycosyltransferase involved in cell wall biosynthesis
VNAAIIYTKLAPFHYARLEVAGKFWAERGTRLTCIEIAREQANYSWNKSEYSAQAFDYVSLFDSDYFTLGYRAIRQALNNALDEARPDVVVINGWGHEHSAVALGWCCRRGVARLVVSDSQEIDLPRWPLKEAVKKAFVGQCHAGFAGGAPQVRYLETLGMPAEFCVVGCDVVDNEVFAKATSDALHKNNGNGHERLRLLSCLRFLEHKNIPLVLRALARLELPWEWRLAGYGPERENIERCVEKLGLKERVHLLGHVAYDALPPLFATADVYLQPSLSEPWGLAVNEALAAGLPVIVSRQCGCREDLVREGVNGYLFNPESVDDLIGALEKIWERRRHWAEMGRASRQIIDYWSLDLFAANLWRACELAIERARESKKESSAIAGLCKLL